MVWNFNWSKTGWGVLPLPPADWEIHPGYQTNVKDHSLISELRHRRILLHWCDQEDMQKTPHPLISLFIISASIQHFLPLIERYISRTPTSLGPVQLCLQQNCNIGSLPTDRALSKWLCRAEERALTAKLSRQVFLLSGHQEHLFPSKSLTSVVERDRVSLFYIVLNL